jgi:hypothetical protein
VTQISGLELIKDRHSSKALNYENQICKRFTVRTKHTALRNPCRKKSEGFSKYYIGDTCDGNIPKEWKFLNQTPHSEGFEKLKLHIFLPNVLLVWLNSSRDIDGDRAERCNQRSSRAAESLGHAVDIYKRLGSLTRVAGPFLASTNYQ